MTKFSGIKYIFAGILVLILAPQFTLAAPSISSVTATSFENGSAVTIGGSGFGADVDISTIQWLKPNIESQENGITLFDHLPANWTANNNSSAGSIAPVYDSSNKHSGTKSIKCRFYGESGVGYGSGFYFNNVDQITSVFTASWIKFSPNQTAPLTAQWKRLEVSEKAGAGSSHIGFIHDLWVDFSGGQCGKTAPCWFNNNSLLSYYSGQSNAIDHPHYQPVFDNFLRWDSWAKYGSGDDVPDGAYSISIYNPADGPHLMGSGTGKTSTAGQTLVWRWVNMGAYWGNLNPALVRDLSVWWDDVYISINNGQARVELCDSPAWSTRKHCEIQPPSSWSDSSVSITLNQSSFEASDMAYLYAVDSTGVVNSAGYPITIGGSQQPDTVSPEPPTGVEVN